MRKYYELLLTVMGVVNMLFAVVWLIRGDTQPALGAAALSMACFAHSQIELRSRLDRLERRERALT